MKHSHIIVYWLWKEKKDQETKEKRTLAKPFYYRVWEINTQCTGLTSKRKIEVFEYDPIEKAEQIFKGYHLSPDFTIVFDFYYDETKVVEVAGLQEGLNYHKLVYGCKPKKLYILPFFESMNDSYKPSTCTMILSI